MDSNENLMKLLEKFADHVSEEEIMFSKVSAEFSTQITKERLRSRMNQKDFAELLGCTQAYISNIEGGECNFTMRKMAQIAVKLDMDLEVKLKPNSEKISREVLARVKKLEPSNNVWSSNSYKEKVRLSKYRILKSEDNYNYV